MHRRPLGCVTGIALVFGAATVLVLVAAAIVTGNGIFSPGALNAVAGAAELRGVRAHADLSGDCGACHTAIWTGDTMADRCLACHTAVTDELAAGTGLHGRFASAGECTGCHTEHHGPTASLTVADLADFPHERTGYSLQAHPVGGPRLLASFGCADCHPRSVRSFEPDTCLACHEGLDAPYMSVHVADFGTGCRACHDGIDTHGADFTHATWALEGGHAGASCSGCHAGATDLADLRAAPTSCVACHRQDDPHDGRLGTDCAACHVPSSWTTVTDEFDHALTRFELTGLHAGVDCLACHVNRAWTGIGTTCEACHGGDDDPHGGQFEQSCAACHSTRGWDELDFDHARTGFALVGAHAGPDCVACHADGRFADTPTDCVACHRADDAHEGNVGTACETCHQVSTWADTTFEHSAARFPLTGSHATALCSACHRELTMYRGTPTTCYACHRRDDIHDGGLGTDCSSCHGTRTWRGARFDHDDTGFRLVGAHADTRCTACHAGNTYAGTPTTCYACHQADDEHDGAFGRSCGACHSPRGWENASVDHDRTAFPLTGAHRTVSCSRCHPNGRFSGTPTACAACHDKPSTHQPRAFSACASCHSTRAWRPAAFDAPHSFPMSHRNADGVCSRCHPASWASYSCASCHPNAKMDEHHKEVSGYSRSTCATCHPRGTKEDDD